MEEESELAEITLGIQILTENNPSFDFLRTDEDLYSEADIRHEEAEDKNICD